MQERNSIDRIVYAARDGELSIDAAIAAVTGEILADPFLREAAVKRMFAQIMTGKWEWDEPPLAEMISDAIKSWLGWQNGRRPGSELIPTMLRLHFGGPMTLDPYGVWPDLAD